MRVPRAEVTQKGFSAEGPTAANDDDDGWRPDFFPNQRVVCSHGISHTTLRRLSTYAAALLISSASSLFFIVFSFSKITRWYPFRKKQASKNFKLSLFKFGDTPLRGEGVHKGLFGKSLPHACYAKTWLFSRIFLFSRWMVGYDTIRTYDCGFVSQMSAGAPDAINTWILDCFVFLCTVQETPKNESSSPPLLSVCIWIWHQKSLNCTHVPESTFQGKLGIREALKN